MTGFGDVGEPESSKHFCAEITVFASLWSVIWGKLGRSFDYLTFSCHLLCFLCKSAEMPHFRAAFLLCIFFVNTFWRRWRDSNSRALLRRLPHFECGPFNRLGTSPNIKLCACTLREMLSGGHRFTEYLLCHTFSCFAREKRRRGRKGPIFKKMIGKLKNFLDISRISYIII